MSEVLPIWRQRRFWLAVAAVVVVALGVLVIRGDGSTTPPQAAPAAEAPR